MHKIIPPANSALLLNAQPKRFPNFTPIKEKIKVITPIVHTEMRIFVFGNRANVIPTAKASILVAIAKTKSSLMFN